MKAVVYVQRHPGEGFDEEVARAHAFCAEQGLEPIRLYHSDFMQDKPKVAQLLAAARCGSFDVVVAPYPDCFTTTFLRQLIASGAGLACYNA